MSALNTLVDGFYTLTAGERTWKMRSIIDNKLQADFARWNFQQAVEVLKATKDLYTEAEFDAERVKLREQFAKGEFGFKSRRGVDSVTTLPGLTFMCSQLIEGVDERTVTAVLVECVDQVKELIRVIITDSFPELKTAQKKVEAKRAQKSKQKAKRR